MRVAGTHDGPVIRRLTLPNGDIIVSLREDVFQRALAEAAAELRRVRKEQTHGTDDASTSG